MFLKISGGGLSKFRDEFFFPIVGVSLTVAALAGAAVLSLVQKKTGIPLAFDLHDIDRYFDSARWIIEGGRLYREVPSEYPLFANIIFATVRYLANFLHPGKTPFFVLWIASTWAVYLYAVYRVATGTTMLVTLAWLAPASIHFAVFRFDIYPAVATLMSLIAIRRTSYMEGAIWLGVAAALKGYALWLLPAYCVFMFYERGFTAAIKVGVLAVAPMILSLIATLTFAGWEGMIAPFGFHALRTTNGESTYDAINSLFSLFSVPAISNGPDLRLIAQSLQVGCALTAAAMRPRSFDDLVNAFLFAVLGFMSFSIFYSPQFLLWILPLICFSRSRVMVISVIVYSWLTYLYFPIGLGLYFVFGRRGLLDVMVVAVSLLRLFMMALAIKGHLNGPEVRAIGRCGSGNVEPRKTPEIAALPTTG
jgi:hypothetical protein